MAKEKRKASADSAPVLTPEPFPKVGDTVNYIVAERQGEISGKTFPATIKFVHDGHDGRLVDIEVETGRGPHRFGPTPYRDADENAGNTWHWPEKT